MKRRWLYPFIFSAALISYSVFALLDTFVIRKDVVAVSELEAVSKIEDKSSAGDSSFHFIERSTSAGSAVASTSLSSAVEASLPEVTENTYKSDNLDIKLYEVREYDTTIYIADVLVTDLSALKSGLAEDSFGRNVSETTSSMAERLSAILAINGDYYGFRNTGYVMRNSLLYRSTPGNSAGDLVLYSDGRMEIINESEISAEELLEKGATDIWSFGPGLVENGVVTVSENDEVGRSMTSNPRTAIGMVEPGHYFFVVSDGRTNESEGLSLYQLADIMKALGCTVAYNLDGGGSSTMYFNGRIINNPTTNKNRTNERAVSDIIYVGT